MKSDPDVLWRQYTGTRGVEDRNALVVHYQPLVRKIAQQMAAKMPSQVAVEDLVSYGQDGLIRAVERFEPERGLKFSTFAAPRIRGSVLDCARNQDWVPRSVRRKMNHLERCKGLVWAQTGEPPTAERLAKLWEVSVSTAQARVHRLTQPGIMSHTAAASPDERPASYSIQDRGAVPPERPVEMQSAVNALLGALTLAERTVVWLYHLEELTMKEVGERVGKSESRVSQMCREAMKRLQAAGRSAS